MMRRLWNAIAKGWFADVPEVIACCEFNCRELRCEQGRWETCEHRLHSMAVVEEHLNQGAEEENTAGAQDRKAEDEQ